MYRQNEIAQTTIQCNESYEGERIEQKVNRIVNNKEPIKDGAPLNYSERGEGVKADTNIRTDRFDIAVTAQDYVSRAHVFKRQERQDKRDGVTRDAEGKVIPIQKPGQEGTGEGKA